MVNKITRQIFVICKIRRMRQVKSEKMKQDRQDKKIMRLVRNRIGQEYRMLNRNKIRIRQE